MKQTSQLPGGAATEEQAPASRPGAAGALGMYEASVPVFTQMLGGLADCLQKAQVHAEQRNYDPAVLVGSRLTLDMMPLAQQVQVATNHATGAPARLAGLELPVLSDDARTLDDLLERIHRATSFLQTIAPSRIDGSEDREIVLLRRAHLPHLQLAGIAQLAQDQYPMNLYPMAFKGRDYLLRFALPNFYFHVATAYAILRTAGVGLGKHDYLGQLPNTGA